MNHLDAYKRHRFLLEIIQYAVWLCHRFNLSKVYWLSEESLQAMKRFAQSLLLKRGFFVADVLVGGGARRFYDQRTMKTHSPLC